MDATRTLLPNADLPTPSNSAEENLVPLEHRNRALSDQARFFGVCCKPLHSFCCGCPLQLVLKFLGTVALVLGGIGLAGSLLTLGLIPLGASVIPLCRYIALTMCGYFLWTAASHLDAKSAHWALVCIAVLFVVDVSYSILAIVYVEVFSNAFLEELRNEYIARNEVPPSDKELEKLFQVAMRLLIISVSISVILEALLLLGASYIIWSFATLAKRGEVLLLTLGTSELPTVGTQLVAQQYRASYPQAELNPPTPPTRTIQLSGKVSQPSGPSQLPLQQQQERPLPATASGGAPAADTPHSAPMASTAVP